MTGGRNRCGPPGPGSPTAQREGSDHVAVATGSSFTSAMMCGL